MGAGASTCTCAKAGDIVVSAATAIADIVEDTVHDMATTITGGEAIKDEEMEQRTPAPLWFRPHTGWPAAVPEVTEDWKPPPLLMPTAEELPEHFQRESIGTLWIEVLECDALPQLLQLGRVDPYVVVLFEGNAARTAGKMNQRNPRWSAHQPRAFRFPITCPYSTVFIGVNDEDRGKDDGLGRVVVSLTSLRAHTLYDTWFPLQFGTLKYHVGRRGYVRLRFSLEFHSPRTRLLSYLKPHPSFVVPFYHEETDAAFAYRGRFPAHKFKWAIFSSVRRGLDPSDLLRPCLAPFAPLAHPATRGSPAQHLKELKASAFSIRDVAEQFLFCA